MKLQLANAARGVTRLSIEQTTTLLFFITIGTTACLMPLQNDTWWHLRTGEEMWLRRAVMLQDQFSFTAYGAYWANHQWLGQILFYSAYSFGGLGALTLLAAACFSAAIWLSWRLMVGPSQARLLLMACGVSALTSVWTARPYVFSHLLLMVTVHLCLRRAFWALPPMFALWANLHGGVVLGFVALGAMVVAETYAFGLRRVITLLPIVGACLVAATLTPLGTDLLFAAQESIAKSVAIGVQEYQPPTLAWRHCGFWLLVIGFAVATLKRWRSPLLREDALLTILALLLLALALRHGRNMAAFALVAIPAVSRALRLGQVVRPINRPEHYRLNYTLVGLCTVAAPLVVLWAWSSPHPRLGWTPVTPTLVQAVRQCPGRLYNRFDDGAYLMWFARVPVYVDSRQDPYSLPFLKEHLRHESSGDYGPVFEKHGLRCAFLPHSSPTARRLVADGWQVTASDESWLVLYAAQTTRGSTISQHSN